MPYYRITLRQVTREIVKATASVAADSSSEAHAMVAKAHDVWGALTMLGCSSAEAYEYTEVDALEVTVKLERDPNQLDLLTPTPGA